MATKFLTGAWESQETENQEQRDARRAAFWAELGLTPAKDSSEIHLAPGTRLSTLETLVAKTIAGRESNAQLKASAALVGALAAEHGLGSLSLDAPSLAFSWMTLHPIALKAFFLQWHVTAFEHSKMDG